VGWVSLVSFLGGMATYALQAMQQVVSMNLMYHYGFATPSGGAPSSTQSGQFGIAVAILCFGAVCSLIPIRHVNRLALASFSWLLMAAVTICIVVPSIAPASGVNPLSGQVEALRRSGAFVFSTDPGVLSASSQVNGMFSEQARLGSRTDANAYTVCNGLLMSQFLILVFDIPSHMAEETKRAAYTVPRAMLTAFFLGCAINWSLLLSYLFAITNLNNAAIPGFGITGSCQTINQGTLDFADANAGALPPWGGLPFGMGASGFGDLPPWSTNAFPGGVPNDGVPLVPADGGCILSNGLPFSYSPVGTIFYDAFAARFPRCTPEEAFGAATWALGADGVTLEDTGAETGVYNVNNCFPLNTPADVLAGATACCDVTGAIAPSANGRNGAIFFLFLVFIGTMFTVVLSFIAGSRFIYSFARDRGFPGSLNALMAYVEPRSKVPLGSVSLYLSAAIGACCVLACCVRVPCFFFSLLTHAPPLASLLCAAFVCCWTNASPTVAFAAVTGINANGFLMCYGVPCLLRVTTGMRSFLCTKEFSLGRLSVPIAVLGAMYGAFSNATIALPFFYPQTANTVNYAPVALAAVILLSFVLYPLATSPRLGWGYKGPAMREPRPGEASVRAGTGGGLGDADALAKEVHEESVRMGVFGVAATPAPAAEEEGEAAAAAPEAAAAAT
jgi:amino acid transporter